MPLPRMIAAMRYLRMLTNAIAGGVLVAIYLVGPRAAAQSAGAGGVDDGAAVVRRAARVLRAVPQRRALFPDPRPRSAGVAAAAAGVAERAAARVARRGGRGARGRAHLGEPAAASARADARPRAERMRRARWRRRCLRAVLVAVALLRYSFGRRGQPAAARAARRLDDRCRSSCPLWVRGPGELAGARPRRRRSQAQRDRHAAARAARPARRRVARVHPAARRRRAAAELRQADRPRRRRSISATLRADAGRAGLGRGGHREVPAEERHPIERASTASRTTTVRSSICCRTTASRTRSPYQGFVRADAADVGGAARAAALGHPGRLRRRRRHRQLAAHVAGRMRDADTSSAIRSTRPPARRCGSADAQRRRSDDGRGHRARGLRPLAGARRGRTSCRRSRPASRRRRDSHRARWDRAYARGGGRARAAVRAAAHRGALRGRRRLRPHATCATRSRSCSATSGATDPHRSLLDRYYAYIDGEIGRAIARWRPATCCSSSPASAWSRTRSSSACSRG